MHARIKNDNSFQEAYEFFSKAVEIDSADVKSLYYLGLMNLLGYGRDQNIEKAMDFFSRPGMDKDPKALNAKGFIFFYAPKVFEQDPVQLALFGSIKQDLK